MVGLTAGIGAADWTWDDTWIRDTAFSFPMWELIAMNLKAWTPRMLSLLRIVSGLAFLEHGTGKFLGFPHLPSLPPAGSLPWFGGVFELVGGALLVLGLFSRPVALLLSGEMAVAYWTAHFPHGPFPALNGGDAAILYCFVFLYIVFAGPGPWSLDRHGRP
jgi:putative oxidoreductase